MANGCCSKCKCVLTEENATPSVVKRVSGYCRKCVGSPESRKKINERRVERYKVESEYKKKERKRQVKQWRLWKYGISIEDFEKRLIEQNNLCGICKRELAKPCVDHNHFTGKTRDILCRHCNCLLGYAQEDIDILEKAIVYLRKHAESSSIQTQNVIER